MSCLIPQFQDLTEWYGVSDGYNVQESLKAIKTEFTFAVAAPSQNIGYLIKEGFNHLSSMNNWWPSHCGQNRELKFLWLKKEGILNLAKAPLRSSWGFGDERKEKYLSDQLAKGGCGFKLAIPPIASKDHYRYFTLMRLPVRVSSLRQKLLAKLNYRLIDTGKLASYWVNGWEPKVYSHEMEYKFFGITQSIWSSRGDDWWTYEPSQHKK
jgi:hypothetical protein